MPVLHLIEDSSLVLLEGKSEPWIILTRYERGFFSLVGAQEGGRNLLWLTVSAYVDI